MYNPRIFSLLVFITLLSSSCSSSNSSNPTYPNNCENFESLSIGSQIGVASTPSSGFQPPNGDFWGYKFEFKNGTVTNDGSATIENLGKAGGAGNEVKINNMGFVFSTDIGQTLSRIRFFFGEYGGNINLSINDEFINFDDFSDINGMTIGGIQVSVLSGGNGNDTGEIEFSGTIRGQQNLRSAHFMIGGEELWIDNFCWE